MDLDKLDRAKEIQRQLTMLRSFVENFPVLETWDFIAELLADEYDDYKEDALRSLNHKIRVLELEFSEL